MWNAEGHSFSRFRKTILRELGVDPEKEPVDRGVHNYRVKRKVLCNHSIEAFQDYRVDGGDRLNSNPTIQGHQNED